MSNRISLRMVFRKARFGALALAMAAPALADLITTATAIGPSQTVDFSQFAGAKSMTITPTTPPVTVAPGVTLTSTNPDGSLLGSGPYSFNDNGAWNASTNLAGLNVNQFGGDTYTMTFTFANPVAAVGGFLNYASLALSGFSDATIAVFDKNGNMLGIADLTKNYPVTNQNGEFLGFADSQADISSFSLSNSAIAIQNLTFSGNAPEPAALYLLPVGGALLFIHRRCFRSGPGFTR